MSPFQQNRSSRRETAAVAAAVASERRQRGATRMSVRSRAARAVLIVCLASAVLVGAVPPQAFAAGSGSVDTVGADSVTNSTTDTTGGSTVNWATGYSNTTASPNGDVSGFVTNSIGADQTYQTGSLDVPPGWNPRWSTNGGASYSTTEPVSGVTNVRMTNQDVNSPSTSSSSSIPPTVTAANVNSATGGDGFRPIPYGNRIFNVYHHAGAGGSPTDVILSCTLKSTGNTCPGYPIAPSAFTGGPATSNWPHEYLDTATGEMWFPIHKTANGGFQCFDLDTATGCGYVSLTDVDAPRPNVAGLLPTYIEGLHRLGGNLYGVSPEGVHCMVLATEAPCAGQPYTFSGNAATNWSVAQHSGSGFVNGVNWGTESFDGRLYYTVNYETGRFSGASQGGRLACFDPATNSACAGWGTAKTLTDSVDWHTGFESGAQPIFPKKNAAGVTTGVCVINWNSLNDAGTGAPWHFVECWNNDGTTTTDPPGMSGTTWLGGASNRQWINAMVYEDRLFVAGHGNTTSSGDGGLGLCYDYTAQAPCAGWGTTGNGRTFWGFTNPESVDYAYASDGSGCLLALGHEGRLWTFDPRPVTRRAAARPAPSPRTRPRTTVRRAPGRTRGPRCGSRTTAPSSPTTGSPSVTPTATSSPASTTSPAAPQASSTSPRSPTAGPPPS